MEEAWYAASQEEANARAGDLTQLGEEYLPLRLVKRRRIQGCQKLEVGLGGDHVCMVTKWRCGVTELSFDQQSVGRPVNLKLVRAEVCE